LKVKKILIDCDHDTLLIMATPAGPVCHDGPDTCFNEINEPDILFLDYLQQLIFQRKRELPEGSYTAELFRKGTAAMAQKTGEEAVELVIEAMGNNDAAFLDEAADLLFHYLVLLADRGLSLQDVTRTLYQRHQ
jgi:phosphoribosyl-ATP pyrophosphohydrolase/phosphoribosyl-AMP cyclohydrolase